MVFCQSCGAGDFTSADRFCPRCGKALPPIESPQPPTLAEARARPEPPAPATPPAAPARTQPAIVDARAAQATEEPSLPSKAVTPSRRRTQRVLAIAAIAAAVLVLVVMGPDLLRSPEDRLLEGITAVAARTSTDVVDLTDVGRAMGVAGAPGDVEFQLQGLKVRRSGGNDESGSLLEASWRIVATRGAKVLAAEEQTGTFQATRDGGHRFALVSSGGSAVSLAGLIDFESLKSADDVRRFFAEAEKANALFDLDLELEEETTSIPAGTEYVDDPGLLVGEEVMESRGQDAPAVTHVYRVGDLRTALLTVPSGTPIAARFRRGSVTREQIPAVVQGSLAALREAQANKDLKKAMSLIYNADDLRVSGLVATNLAQEKWGSVSLGGSPGRYMAGNLDDVRWVPESQANLLGPWRMDWTGLPIRSYSGTVVSKGNQGGLFELNIWVYVLANEPTRVVMERGSRSTWNGSVPYTLVFDDTVVRSDSFYQNRTFELGVAPNRITLNLSPFATQFVWADPNAERYGAGSGVVAERQ